MSKAQTASGDSSTDEIEEKDYNELRSHVAEETEYKATGDIDTLRQKARGEFEPEIEDDSEDGVDDADPGEKEAAVEEDDEADSDDGEDTDAEDADADEDAAGDDEAGSEDNGAIPNVPNDNRPGVPGGKVGQFSAAIEVNDMQSFISKLDPLVEEAKIHVSNDGIRTIAVDPANVGMVDAGLSVDAFQMLETDGGVLGLNLDRLDELVGLAENKSDLIHLELDAAKRKLRVSVGNIDGTMALIDPDSIRQEPELPALELPMYAKMKGKELKQGLTAADMVSDHVQLQAKPNSSHFTLTAEGDTDSISKEFEEDRDLALYEPGEANSLFSLEYLKDITKPITKQTIVSMELGEEFPVILSHDFAGNNGTCVNMIAPRIQSD
jgi:proliferating cell nuclear antigen